MQRSSNHKYWTLPSYQAPIHASKYESFHPDTQWLFLAPYHDAFKYNTYAALHIIQKTNSEVGSYPPPLSHMPASCSWHPLRDVCTSVQMQNEEIGKRVGRYIHQKIYPYLEKKVSTAFVMHLDPTFLKLENSKSCFWAKQKPML
jgi:hypothetical protein